MTPLSKVIRLTHPRTEGEIHIILPMSMTIAGKVLAVLGRLGFELQTTEPAADEAAPR